MASLIPRFFLLLLPYFFHQIAEGQALIRGTIRGENIQHVMLFQPINNFSNSIIAKPEWKIFPDRNGYFEKFIELSEPNTLTLQIGLEPIWIFVEPNDTIDVSVDLDKFTNESPNGGILFTGKNAGGNEYFNLFNFQPGKKMGDFNHIVDSLGFHKNANLSILDTAMALVTAFFDSLRNSGSITNSFYEGVVPGIRATLLGTQFRYFLVDQHATKFGEGLSMSQRILDCFPIDLMFLRSSVFISSIGYWVAMVKEYEHESKKTNSDSVISTNGQNLVIKKGLKKWLFLPKDVQEILWPLNLVSLMNTFADSFGQQDVDAYLALFPESPLKSYLRPSDVGIGGVANHIDSSEIHIINDTSFVSFLSFLKTNLSGKKLYIDFWASWCAPCKFEFRFNQEVDSFLNKYGISKLYVSFDQLHLRNNMISSIYSYNLKGYHIQLNESMYHEIQRLFYPDGQFSIPRYLIVDERGEILNSDAPRPSDQALLFKELKMVFGFDDD